MSALLPVLLLILISATVLYWRLPTPENQRDLVVTVTLSGVAWWDVRLLAILLFLVWLVWLSARETARWELGEPERKIGLLWGMFGAASAFSALKAMGFFKASYVDRLGAYGFDPSWPVLNLVVPMGLTLIILQSIRYAVDVHRDDIRASRSIRQVAAFILFFPGFAVGPMMPAGPMLNQFKERKRLSRNQVSATLRALLIGFVFKFAIADSLGMAISPAFAAPAEWTNLALFGATIAVGAQIFFDVAGCALMAVGMARGLGYGLPEAHGFPFCADNVPTALSRFHPTLSQWVQAYVVRPFTALRPHDLMDYRSIFLVGGLGIVWAIGHGAMVGWVIAMTVATALNQFFFRDPGITLHRWVATMATVALFILATPFARCDTPAEALQIIAAMIGERDGGSLALDWTVWSAPFLLAAAYWLSTGRLPSPGVHSGLRTPVVYWAGLGAMAALVLAFFPIGSSHSGL